MYPAARLIDTRRKEKDIRDELSRNTSETEKVRVNR